MARPPTESNKIDRAELEKLMKLHPSEQEAADWFDVTTKTLQRFIKKHYQSSFVQLREKSFARTRIAIKRAQIEKALKGDNTMLIWTGKQYLGQSDKQSTEISGPNGKPLEHKDVSEMPREQRLAEIAALVAKLNGVVLPAKEEG
jgi:hypothetical protein